MTRDPYTTRNPYTGLDEHPLVERVGLSMYRVNGTYYSTWDQAQQAAEWASAVQREAERSRHERFRKIYAFEKTEKFAKMYGAEDKTLDKLEAERAYQEEVRDLEEA